MSRKKLSEYVRRIFSMLDDRDFKILSILAKMGPSTGYDILRSTIPKGGKNPEIPRSTLYRKIKQLEKNGFIEKLEQDEFRRGKLVKSMPIYYLTFKGSVASLRYWSPKIKTRNEEKVLKNISSWISWHVEKGIDLSTAKVDFQYFLFSSMLMVIENPRIAPKMGFPSGLIVDLRNFREKLHREECEFEKILKQFLRVARKITEKSR